jgi:hypothetical protein
MPGYLKLSLYDENQLKKLENLRSKLIEMRYSFDKSFEDLKKDLQENAFVLKEEKIDDLLNKFVVVCDRIKNLDVSLWSLTLEEITERINNVSKRSKHPFPKLIDIISLAGLSFLLAQFLKLLG